MTKQELKKYQRNKRYRQLWPLVPKWVLEDNDRGKSAGELANTYNETYKENLSSYQIGSMLRILSERGYTVSEIRKVGTRNNVAFWCRFDKDIEAFVNGLR